LCRGAAGGRLAAWAKFGGLVEEVWRPQVEAVRPLHRGGVRQPRRRGQRTRHRDAGQRSDGRRRAGRHGCRAPGPLSRGRT